MDVFAWNEVCPNIVMVIHDDVNLLLFHFVHTKNFTLAQILGKQWKHTVPMNECPWKYRSVHIMCGVSFI